MAAENKITNQGKSIKVTLDVYVFIEGDTYISYSPALDLSGYGLTEDEAMNSFAVVIEQYILHGISKHTLVKDLREHGWKVRSFKQRKISAPTFNSLFQSNETFRDILQNREYRKFTEPFPEVC